MKKRFLYLLLGLDFLLVSSISMSLAWYVGSNSAKIESFNFQIDVDADLKIAVAPEDNNLEYEKKDSLTESDFGKVGAFIPVTSMLSEHSEWINDPHNTKPEFYAQYKRSNLPSPKPTLAKKGYFTQRFYLFSDHHILATFDSDKTVIKANTELNEAKASQKANEDAKKAARAKADAYIEERGITDEDMKQTIFDGYLSREIESLTDTYIDDLNAVVDSVRISILDYQNLTHSNYTIIDPKKTENPVVFGGRLSTSLTKDYFDYYGVMEGEEPVYRETLFGDIKPREDGQDIELKYLPVAEEDIPAQGQHTCFNAGTKKGVMPLDMDYVKENVEFYTEQSITPEEADVTKHTGDETTGYMIELIPGVPHPLTVSVYLEGWDTDNIDNSQEASFDVDLHFRLYRQCVQGEFD